MRLRHLSCAAALAAALVPAHAVDGVILIDQAKALAGNITPGDAPGFPVTISRPGSYRLAGNLTVGDVALAGIQITAEDVTIDLNGFSLSGARCGPERCHINPSAAAIGIGGGRNVSVMNGTVTNFGGTGVHVSDRGTLVNLRLTKNGGCGAILNSVSMVRDSVFSENLDCGLRLAQGVARHNLFFRNQVRQVYSGGYALFSGNNSDGTDPFPPATQSLGDNLCTPPGGQQQRC